MNVDYRKTMLFDNKIMQIIRQNLSDREYDCFRICILRLSYETIIQELQILINKLKIEI